MQDNRRSQYELPDHALPPGYVHQVFNELGSTMDAVDAVMRGPAEQRKHGLVVQALTQVRGTGTNGRRWESPAGNLYFSMLIEQKKVHHRTLALLAALAVIQAAEEVSITPVPTFKMPNDVLIDDAKLCGILAEKSLTYDGFANIGIGINVHNVPVLADARNTATSLAEHGWPRSHPAEDFLGMFLERFEHGYRCSQMSQSHVFVELGAVNPADDVLTIRNAQDEEISGQFAGFLTEEDGKDYLLISSKNGTQRSNIREASVKLLDGRWTSRYPYPS